MPLVYFCRRCKGDAGTKNGLCLECDSKVGVPRFGRRDLTLSRQADEDAVARARAVPLDLALEKARKKSSQRDSTPEEGPSEPNSRERQKLAEVRRSEKLEAKKAAERARRAQSSRPPAPPPLPYGVSPEGAEHLVADWMRHVGAVNVSVTSFQSDGGIDVQSDFHVAQVKLYTASSVGRPEVQQLVGAALVSGKKPLFFTSSGFSPGAKRFATEAEVALFKIVPESGVLLGVNSLGRQIREDGLSGGFKKVDTI